MSNAELINSVGNNCGGKKTCKNKQKGQNEMSDGVLVYGNICWGKLVKEMTNNFITGHLMTI